jgi:hypothetical protein
LSEQQKSAQRDLAIGFVFVVGLVLGAIALPAFFPCVYHGGTVGTMFGISACADGAVRVRQ